MPSSAALSRVDRGLLLRLSALVLVIVALVVTAVVVGAPTPTQLRSQFAGSGPLGALTYAGTYAVVTLTPLPKTLFSIAAGAVFGLWMALPIVVVGATVGALLAYGLARLLGRDAVRRLAGHHLDRAAALLVKRRAGGFWALLVLRLVPVVPFTVLNYAGGLVGIRLLPYFLATVLGILPGVAVATTVGAYGLQPGSWPLLIPVVAVAVLAPVGWRLLVRRRRIGGTR